MTLTHRDVLLEWKTLAAFKNYPEELYDTTVGVFTDYRRDVYTAMINSYAIDGQITLEGIQHQLGGELPEELTVDVTMRPIVGIRQLTLLARRRQLETAADTLKNEAAQFQPDEVKIRETLSFEPISPSQDVTLHKGSLHLITDINRKRSGDYQFAKSGLEIFDSLMGGEWPRRSLIIIKARPGVGKTALACTSMLSMAENGIPSHFWSMEMAKELLMVRWIASKIRVDNTRIQMGKSLTAEELAKVEKCSTYIESLPMTVNESRPTIDEIIAETHYLVVNKGVRVFFLDYIQIAQAYKFGNKNQDLGYFALQLKELAKKHDVTFVVLSQVNDQDEVRDSGEVEQVADTSIFLYPDDKPDTEGVSIIRARWDKNRTGPVGKDVAVVFNGKYQYFSDVGPVD